MRRPIPRLFSRFVAPVYYINFKAELFGRNRRDKVNFCFKFKLFKSGGKGRKDYLIINTKRSSNLPPEGDFQ